MPCLFEDAGRGNFLKGKTMILAEELEKPYRNSICDNSLDDDFEWLGKQNRKALCHLLLNVVRNGRDGVPFEYMLLMPPLKKARQMVSRDAKHRSWNGYNWENV